MKLMKTSDAELTYLRAIVYGDSGVGKTTSLRTLPVQRTLLAITERSAIPLRKDNYDAFRLESWSDARELLGYFLHPDENAEPAWKKTISECRVLVIDSLSELSDMAMRHILEVDRKALVSERTKGKRDTPDNVYEDLMGMEDWGLLRSRMRSLLAAFCQLKVHVIFTALAAWSTDKDGGATYRTPALSGKLATECPAFFDLVFHMESMAGGAPGKAPRVWRTFNDGRIVAKDASGVLEPFVEPNWTDVFKAILKPGKDGAK